MLEFSMLTKKNIVLIGFMASGKSLISNELSRIWGRKCVSTDQLIVKREGLPIKAIFDQKGEEYFRNMERQIIQDVSALEEVIVDCGGGVVLNTENIANLKKTGVLIYLKNTPERVVDRVKGSDKRPLLNVDNLLEKVTDMMNARESYYQQADHVIDVHDKTPSQIIHTIRELVEHE